VVARHATGIGPTVAADMLQPSIIGLSLSMERPIGRDVGRLFALGSVLHVEADFLVFLQRFEACCIHFGEVGEQILAAVIRRIDA
jgi:hypothetical protein